MNTFWSLISYYLPSVRVYNDIEDCAQSDYDDQLYELPTTNSYSTTPIARLQGQRHDRMPPKTIMNYNTTNNNDNRQSRIVDSRRSPTATETEQANRIKELEQVNQRLQSQVLTLQRQLEHLQSDMSGTKLELENQRGNNALLLRKKSQLEGQLGQARSVQQAQSSEIHELRSSYADLSSSVNTLAVHNEELATLKSFLSKTDEFTGAQILQAVQDLNTEIMQLAATVSEEFCLSRRNGDLSKESDCEIVRNSIGEGMLELLRDGDHEQDPTVVQLAVQAWEVWCCRQILDAFCFGVPPDVDRFLSEIFHGMQTAEPQPTSSRWRALAHKHARNMVAAYPSPGPGPAPAYPGSLSSSSLTSPISPPPYPTPNSTLNNTPASQTYALPPPHVRTQSTSSAGSSASPAALHTAGNIRGLLAILALAGCTDEGGVHREPLRARFGELVCHVAEQAETLARAIREGVGSAWFEVVTENALAPMPPPVPVQSEVIRRTRSMGLGAAGGKDASAGRIVTNGRWKEKEGSAASSSSWGRMFDPVTMENLYAGHGSEKARVLCTVEFGLAVVKKRREEREEDEWEREQGQGRGRVMKPQTSARGEGGLESTLLLKPKVLLESVKELL
ncbi:hypothetical protein DENSPDRAFT_257400 [Dentipellis sp. KUC8613]|nr:hypothetical protein DENSPDRAFT_257400 [Dentipellis sp. KUC8613]